MYNWRLLGDPHQRYVEPSEDFNGEACVLGETCYVVFSGSLYERIVEDYPEYIPNSKNASSNNNR
jgi:hypothetical protein